jgi:hypothetical protein
MPLGREALPESYVWELCEIEQLGVTYPICNVKIGAEGWI